MRMNVAVRAAPIFTHEGAKAVAAPNAAADLRRAVMACMLWEDGFYESGQEIADRIKSLVAKCPAEVVQYQAIKAREDMKLRHVPLLLVREMCRASPAHRALVAETLARVIQRADEITEFLAIYWATNDGKRSLPSQVKKGLARAFNKFGDYALAKYDRDGAVKLRDALFLCHAKPDDAPERRYTRAERKTKARVRLSPGEKRFKALVESELTTPDTWEVALSGGADKKATFERLIVEDKLGPLALLRNLRNMIDADVDADLVRVALEKMDTTRVLPHRFIAAARAASRWEHLIEPPMLACAAAMPELAGKTLILIDVSGSMNERLSAKSDMTRLDAACGLAIIAAEVCEQADVVTFSNHGVAVPRRRGFALRDAIVSSQPHGGTYLAKAIESCKQFARDRTIVITDEQVADGVPPPVGIGYMINVASNRNGIGYGQWNKIDGFSEAVVRYIAEHERPSVN